MSLNYQGTIDVNITSYCDNNLDLSTARDSLVLAHSGTYADGSGANQAEIHYGDSFVLGTGSSYTLDLTNATGGVYGAAAFSCVKAFYARLDSSTAGDVCYIGSAAANPAPLWMENGTDRTKLLHGGRILWESPGTGATVGASNCNVKFENPSATNALGLQVVIVGDGSM